MTIINPLPDIEILDTSDHKYMIMQTDSIITQSLKTNGSYDGHMEHITHSLISNLEPGIILDIGANMGTYCIPLAKKNPNFLFYAFEPQKIIYYQLCGNIFLNRIKNIDAHNCGVGKENKQILVNIPEYNKRNNIGAFSLDENIMEKHQECLISSEQEEVYIISIDSLNLQNVRLIKIDVEGMEKEVIEGCMETIVKNSFPIIIFEAWSYKEWFQNKRQELYSMLENMGYQISIIGENNIAQHISKPMVNFNIKNNIINWTASVYPGNNIK